MREKFEDYGICRCCSFLYICRSKKCAVIKTALDGIEEPSFKK